jgi:hypothetical protein
MKQTAVEWLMDKLPTIDKNDPYYENIIQQAKAMEKQQIMKAVYDGMKSNFDANMGRAEQYYNETYNK